MRTPNVWSKYCKRRVSFETRNVEEVFLIWPNIVTRDVVVIRKGGERLGDDDFSHLGWSFGLRVVCHHCYRGNRTKSGKKCSCAELNGDDTHCHQTSTQKLRCSSPWVCTLRSCSVQLCCHLSSNLERIIKPTFSKCGLAPKHSPAFLEK